MKQPAPTADVALMADDLGKLPFAVGLSHASRSITRQNLAVIGLLILSSVLGVVQPSGAVILHEGSTILVVLNALRLLRYEKGYGACEYLEPALRCPIRCMTFLIIEPNHAFGAPQSRYH